MRSVLTRSRVGTDGILHLDLPTDFVETELEVIVIVQPIAQSSSQRAEGDVWSSDFLEGVLGKWEGEPLAREWEGEYETREAV